MAGGSLLALLDDIASILDDVSLMSKMAAKKTAGVLGDDLALNAQQVSGVNADRELPVVWAVAKGSLINKVILVPLALMISGLIPWAVMPLLMLGGLYLCFEGCEKLAHRWLHHAETAHGKPAESEKDKIKGAVRTDFILSAEITVISLGTVATASFGKQLAVLTFIAVIMTVGVYGLVAAIVKLDDAGLYLSRSASGLLRRLGQGILRTAPYLMKSLSVAGTIAMFLVGGGILAHGLHLDKLMSISGSGVGTIASALFNGLVGLLAGALVLGGVLVISRLRGKH